MTASLKRQRAVPSLEDVRAALRGRLRERSATDFRAYVEYVHRGRWRPARHLNLICGRLNALERGELTRLIITMPPRHGKSMTVTESFPSWFIGRKPDRRVIEVSYGDKFAQKFGRANRRKIEEFGEELFGIKISRENASVTNWGIEDYPGGMISSGLGGAITGEGADLLIVDDPVKNRKEAESLTYRESVWAEWQDTLLSRLHPGGSVIVIMTRWHEDDLVGRLMEQDGGRDWEVINLPAIAEEGRPDAIDREPGAALWPEIGFDEAWAEKMKARVGVRTWESLFQGRPTPQDGGLFRASTFRRFRAAGTCYRLLTPEGEKIYDHSQCRVFQTCDVAGSKKSSADYFVLGTFALTPNGDILVLDILRERLEGPDQPILIRRKFQEWKPAMIGVESANMGLTLYQQLVRDGLPVLELRPEADKYTRAIPAAARYEAGAVYHRENAPWSNDLEAELIAFPNGAHDDQVDVIAYAAFIQAWGYLDAMQRKADRAFVLG